MKIIAPSELTSSNANSRYIFLDTNVFVAAISDKDFLVFLKRLQDLGHVLFTIPQVTYEFTRGSDTIAIYNRRAQFIADIADTVYPIDKHVEACQEFTVLMQKYRPKGQYTDFLLCTALYALHGNASLLTSDHSAMPLDLFDRTMIITTDNTKEIQNLGLYEINQERLNVALEKLAQK